MWKPIKKTISWVIGKTQGAKPSASPAKEEGVDHSQRSFEIVEVLSPYGKVIRCAKRDAIYIPMGKIEVFGTG